jgi:hypothetical protein
VEDDRVLFFDAWQTDAARTLLERRWVHYAMSGESVSSLIDHAGSGPTAAEEQDAAWRTSLVARIWRPLPWVMSHPSVQAWSELSRGGWSGQKHPGSDSDPTSAGEGTPQARAHTVAAFVGGPGQSDLTDEERAAEAIQASIQFGESRRSIHVGLLALSKDDRSIAAVVAGAAWAPSLSVFAMQPAGSAQTEIAHVTMAAMADRIFGNSSWPEVQVGNALAGMFETAS